MCPLQVPQDASARVGALGRPTSGRLHLGEANLQSRSSGEGHTDDVGSDAYNQLSERRASAVAAYLRSRGIDDGRIDGIGFGETRPLVANDSASARQQNRRVEIVIGGS